MILLHIWSVQRKFEKFEIGKRLGKTVIEPAQWKWASLIEFAPEKLASSIMFREKNVDPYDFQGHTPDAANGEFFGLDSLSKNISPLYKNSLQ